MAQLSEENKKSIVAEATNLFKVSGNPTDRSNIDGAKIKYINACHNFLTEEEAMAPYYYAAQCKSSRDPQTIKAFIEAFEQALSGALHRNGVKSPIPINPSQLANKTSTSVGFFSGMSRGSGYNPTLLSGAFILSAALAFCLGASNMIIGALALASILGLLYAGCSFQRSEQNQVAPSV